MGQWEDKEESGEEGGEGEIRTGGSGVRVSTTPRNRGHNCNCRGHQDSLGVSCLNASLGRKCCLPLVHPVAIQQKASRRLLAWTSTDAWLGRCDDEPFSCAISSCKPPCHKCGEVDRGMTRCKHSDSYHSPPTWGNTDCRCDRRCRQKDSEHPPVSLGETKVQS